jgi:hypothetical protein
MLPTYLKEVPSYRRVGLGVINSLTRKFSYDELTDSQSGFRAYDSEAIRLLRPDEKGMGASTEILLKARRAGLTLRELPAKITYDDPSRRNPLVHGLEVLISTVRQLSINKPLLFYGLPGIISLLISLVFWGWVFQIFAYAQTLVINVALIAMTATMVGLMLMTTGLILWVTISSVMGRSS